MSYCLRLLPPACLSISSKLPESSQAQHAHAPAVGLIRSQYPLITSYAVDHHLNPHRRNNIPDHLPVRCRLILSSDSSDHQVSEEEEEEQEEDNCLPEGLRRERMPKHVAVIMDGNARWARQRGLPREAGHLAGARALWEMVKSCRIWGIQVLTVFAFSTENWKRSKVEVDFLIYLFESEITKKLDACVRDGIQITAIGDLSKFPKSVQTAISRAEETTRQLKRTRLNLVCAIGYSGKQDILRACTSIAHKAKQGVLRPDDIDEKLFQGELETNAIEQHPNPDLLIRTSGEFRVSNFLLWQLAYSELYFSSILWPDFGQDDLVAALKSFQERERRFGERH